MYDYLHIILIIIVWNIIGFVSFAMFFDRVIRGTNPHSSTIRDLFSIICIILFVIISGPVIWTLLIKNKICSSNEDDNEQPS